LPTLRGGMSTGAAAAEAGSEIAANSGRWVKLTKESAELIKKHGLRESKSGLKTGVVKGSKGQVKTFVQFAKGPGTALTSPAVLAGAAGVMAQVAMRQTMDEITDYLAMIDEKVEDVLRAQTDAVLARMIGLGLVIEETLTIREHGGGVNEVTWSKVQAAPATIAETQAYALRQLDALADKLESKRKIADLAKAAEKAEATAQEWLAVLARCWQLQDAIAVLELDRVLDAAPDDLDGHRRGLKAARQDRLELLSRTTDRLTARLDAAAAKANTKVLLHPATSRDIVQASNDVGTAVSELRVRLGIDSGRQSVEARRWGEAAAEVRTKALETGGDGVDAARRMGMGTVRTARSAAGEASRRVVDRPFLRRGSSNGGDGQV
jgi:predicted transcriptional regulator